MHLQLVEPKLLVKAKPLAEIVQQVWVGLLVELKQVAVKLQLDHS